MILAVAATEIEMAPFLAGQTAAVSPCRTLVSGVGPVAASLRLTRFLCESREEFAAVIHFGVGGAYRQPDRQRQPELVDLCLAEREVAGDFGICLGESMAYLDSALAGEIVYDMDADLIRRCRKILASHGIKFQAGVFITVNGITGSAGRGKMLQSRWDGLCENMEGAAVARVCREFDLPCLELRSISNLVGDRDPATWRLQESCQRAAHAAIQVLKGMTA
jgi:futalosine hydrolase